MNKYLLESDGWIHRSQRAVLYIFVFVHVFVFVFVFVSVFVDILEMRRGRRMWTKISWNPVVGYTGRRGPCHKYSLAGAKSSAVDSPGRSSLLLLSIWYSISLTIPIPGWLQYWSRQQCVVLVSEYLCALTSAPRVPEWHTLSIDSPNRNSHWFMHRLLTIKIEQRSISLLNTSMPPP